MDPKLLALKLLLDDLGVDPSIATVDDRKRVQKAIYLSQVAGVDLGYRFGWYVRGPYSPALTNDYYAMAGLGAAGRTDAEGKKLRADFRSRLQTLRPLLTPPTETSLSQEDWLELLASLHFLRTVSRYPADKARQVIEQQKPHLKGHLEAAERHLRAGGLLTDG